VKSVNNYAHFFAIRSAQVLANSSAHLSEILNYFFQFIDKSFNYDWLVGRIPSMYLIEGFTIKQFLTRLDGLFLGWMTS
jgi:hypothetical protein